ncbi:MAG: glycoside hydrolase family 27 protein [Opitutales bacterium]|nr:glycoside hydrolase family 27 protein [Opitutales bacterium]
MAGLFALSAFAASGANAQKFDGLAETPPMGWNSWNTFEINIDEDLVLGVAKVMKESGMLDAGYNYIVLDDGWMTRERDEDGNLVPDPEKFPSGMKHLADTLHEMGFKFGLYNCAGSMTCASFPGSMGHEYQDARLYAELGIDYLKYDWCNTGTRDAQEAYATMRDAIYTAGRPMVFSMCEWGTAKPWLWAKDTGHLWRTTGDIIDCYDCTTRWSRGWKQIADFQATNEELYKAAGPGHWNDPDMMEVGNPGLTMEDNRAMFSLWCMMAAPLIAGNDVRNMSPEVLEILINKEAIAIDQDPLGIQGYRFFGDPRLEIWVRELSGGDWAVCVMNPSDEARDCSVTWEHVGGLLPENAQIRDIWQHKDLGTTEQVPSITRKLAPHDVMMFRLIAGE